MSKLIRSLTSIALLCSLFFSIGCSKQAKLSRHLKRAEGFFISKDYKEAEIEYLYILRLQQTNVLAAKHLAKIYSDRGIVDRTVPLLMLIRHFEPNDFETRLKVAQLYAVTGQAPKAREELLPLLDGKPENDQALVLFSEIATNPKETADVQQHLKKLEPAASTRAAWHLATASLHLRQTNLVAAEQSLQKALAVEPQSAQAHLAMAVFGWLRKDLVKANEEFQKAAELEPINSPMRLRWVDFKLNTGAAKEARELLDQMTQKAPDFNPPWVYLARISFDEQKFQDCSNIVQRVLAQDGGNFEARLLHARLQRVNGNAADAITEMDQLKKGYPRSPELLFQLSLAHLQNRDRQKAISLLEEALKLNPELSEAILLLAELRIQGGESAAAIASLQDLIRKHPEVGRAYYLLASAYGAQARFEDALTIYRTIEKSNPTNAAAPFLSGLAYRLQNRSTEARQSFQKALQLAPYDPLVNYQIVDLEIADKNYEAAFQRTRALLEKNPKLAVAKFLEARVFVAQTNFASAEAALEQSIEWDPNFGSAYTLLAQIYLAQKRAPQAIEKLEQMVKHDTRNLATLILIGTIHEQAGDAQKAVSAYERALKINPSFAVGLNNLAYQLAEKLGRLDEAYAHALKAREVAPDNGSIADTLGWILFRRHEYVRALPVIQEAATKAPQEPEIQFHLAMAHYMMAQEEPARTAFTRSLASAAQNAPYRSQAEASLAILSIPENDASPKTMALLQETLRKQPDDVLAILRLARIYESTGVIDKARQALLDAKAANPASVPVLTRLAEFYSGKGNDLPQALAIAREARKLAPEDTVLGYLVGKLTLQSGGDAQWAASVLGESVRKQASNPEWRLDLAHAHFAVGKIEAADQEAKKSLQTGTTFSRESDAKWLLALIDYCKSPQKRLAAEDQVKQLLKTAPNYLPAQFVAALLQDQHGLTTEAKEAYDKIIGQNPQFAPARKQLASLYSGKLNDQQKAYEYATEARKVLVDDPELAKILGKASYVRGDNQNAVRFLEESSRKVTNDPELLYLLGAAHYRLKHKTESKQALDQALAIGPDAAFASDARKLLAELKK
jgi:tetratricopeptide (TPR) repeat protein